MRHQHLNCFLLLRVKGWVRGEREPSLLVKMGEGVFFDRGEWHESGSLTGMTCIIVQCDELDQSKLTGL